MEFWIRFLLFGFLFWFGVFISLCVVCAGVLFFCGEC